jgi:plasmid maintenance system antidote protein VapI
VAIALRNFVRAMGSRECAAQALDTHAAYITKLVLRKKRAGVGFAARLARYTGVPLETLLAGRLIEAGLCPTCGITRKAG